VRILVVEDESIIADDLAYTLRKHGFEVTALAASGDEAIRAASEKPPALVLMDIHLRGNPNGIETIHAIRQKLGRQIPVIFLTATRIARMEKVAQSMVLDKPFLEKELIRFVQRSLHVDTPFSPDSEANHRRTH
jgi:CheY-like chemotaxis protein